MSRPLPSGERLDELMAVLKALAEPNRLRILGELMQGDSCNCELGDSLGLPANLLSHHLRVMSDANLVTSRRDAIDGRWIYYSVNIESVERYRAWFHAFLDPTRVRSRVLCGPEGRSAPIDLIEPAQQNG